MTLDHRFRSIEPARSILSMIIYPAQYVINIPVAALRWGSNNIQTHKNLIAENKQLKNELKELKFQQQIFSSMKVENGRLRELLGSSMRLDSKVLIAELLAIDLDPYANKVLINKGAHHSVYLNQPALDAFGIFGKVIHVSPRSATIMLISDVNHGIPVQINRNGLRSIAFGSGQSTRLDLLHLPNNSDVREDDLLVSSGLGGVFPKGYPVGRVTSVKQDPGRFFARVLAKPTAHLERSRELILVTDSNILLHSLETFDQHSDD